MHVHKICFDRQTDIDVLKGICILAIIITHFSWEPAERLRYFFPFWIDMAVPVFMIISGYVYAHSYRNHKILCVGDAYLLKNTLNKVIRYTIPFFIIYIIEKIMLYKIGITPANIYEIVSFFLIGGQGPGGYYYPIMIQFVFTYPIIYFIIKKYGFKGLCICGFVNFVYELLKWAYGINEGCYRVLLFRYILVIAFGCYLASEKFIIDKKLCIISFAVGFVFILVVEYLNYIPVLLAYWTKTSFLACLYILPISILLIKRPMHILKCLGIMGKSSYNIFLIQKIYYLYVEHGYSIIYTEKRILQLIINIVICTVIGICFYYVEMPITRRITKKINNWLE